MFLVVVAISEFYCRQSFSVLEKVKDNLFVVKAKFLVEDAGSLLDQNRNTIDPSPPNVLFL